MHHSEPMPLQDFLGRFSHPEDLAPAETALVAAPNAPASERMHWLQQWARSHPQALERVLVHARQLEVELAAARRDAERAERARRMGVPAQPSAEDLRRQSRAWDLLLGTQGGRRQPAVAAGGAAGAAPAARGRPSFEDVGARFFAEHVGKMWAALALLSLVVVLVREGVL